MRSRTTARRTPPPEQGRTPEVAEPRKRATTRATPPASRRSRRAPEPAEVDGSALEAAVPLPTDPGELYRREKSRRVSRVDPAVMAEARRLLEEAMTPIGGRKRGGTVTVGQAARRRKPALKPDEFDLPEYRPGATAARGGTEADEE
ncbi:hypothetical protein [Roseisolibacter agri]|uniref:hypothetical protein n=1 Tax=Roseisolibacter agri TaxID=2014610 RepID=UPI0024E0D9D4|nr:hypothetical protein [Roseisolibacter agri]